MANNTGNPIGSTAAKDLSDNAENLDKLLNGEAYEYTDRLGRERKSLKWMEDASLAIPAIEAAQRSEQQAELSGQEAGRSEAEADRATLARIQSETARDTFNLNIGRKADIAEGIRDTVPGQSFTVLALDSNEYIIEYENNAGAALEKKRYPSVSGVSQSTPNLWPDPFFTTYYAQYGAVSVIPGRMSGKGVLGINNPANPYKGASVDIPAGAGIRNTAFFVPLAELGSFKPGDNITAKVVVVTNGQVRLDVATRSSINGPTIQSSADYKVGGGVVELSASVMFTSPAIGLFLRVQLDDTNTGAAVVAAMVAGKGVGLGYSERAVSSPESMQIAQRVVSEYKVPVLQTEFFRVGKNLYNPATRVDGSYLNISNSPLENSAYFYSDYMPVTALSPYAANTALRFVLFYDSAKAFLGSSTTLESLSQFTPPAGSAFIRVSVVIAMALSLQIEAGAVPTAYESYGYYMRTVDPHGTPINVAPDVPAVTQARPNVYGFEYLRETHQRLRSINLGDTVRLNIGALGDSWIHNAPRWILPTFTTLMAQYGGLGNGWIGLATPTGGTTNGSVRGSGIATLTGSWTSAYATGGGPDAGSVATSEVGATVTTTLNTYLAERNLYLLAMGGSGSVTYKVGSADEVTVDLSALSGVQKISMGTVIGVAAVTVTVVSGSVTLFGLIESLTGKGVGFHKLGSTGSRAAQWEVLDPARFRACIAALALDLAIISFGTNDQAVAATKAAFKASIKAVIDNIRTARPTADILLVAPCENQRGLSMPISEYAGAMYELAVEYKVGFIDLQPVFGDNPGDYAADSARPWFLPDKIHPDGATGGRAIVSAVLRSITA